MNVELLPTAVEEDKVATPQKPTVDDNADTYTIPDIEGVVYKVDGKVLAAGSVVNVGDEDVTVTVTAEPADGYRFPDGVASPVTYELTFTKKGGEKPDRSQQGQVARHDHQGSGDRPFRLYGRVAQGA